MAYVYVVRTDERENQNPIIAVTSSLKRARRRARRYLTGQNRNEFRRKEYAHLKSLSDKKLLEEPLSQFEFILPFIERRRVV